MDSLDLNKETLPEQEQVRETTASATEAAENVIEKTTNHASEVTPAEPTATAEKPKEKVHTKAELICEFRNIIDQPIDNIKEQVESLKQAFYKIYNAEQEAAKQAFAEAGGNLAEYSAAIDEEEQNFKQLMAEFKKRKAADNQKKKEEEEQNLLKKQHILDQMKQLVENGEDVSNKIQDFKQLQQNWKETGPTAASVNTGLWKQYNLYQEQFYDLVKINNELREYDFKKNLDAKTLLCEAAEKLNEVPNIVDAFRELQKLHDEWKDLGPVARELRDEIWKRFQDASIVINKKHQDFFLDLHQQESENLQRKTALCDRLETIDCETLTSFKMWEDQSKEVMDIQTEWRTIGFAPRKANQQIYERYRKLCDNFFEKKSSFYKQTKNDLAQNLDKKRQLCEQAEALKDSTEWKETSDKLIALQKEWKTIGPVAKKYSDEVWKRFLAACDSFFEKKKQAVPDPKIAEANNLALKKELIEKIEHFEKLASDSESVAALRALIEEFNAIGFVPYKEKDKIYKQFRAAVEKQFEALHVDKANQRIDTFRNNLQDMQTKGENKLLDERRKLLRAYDNLKSEIAVSENNIGFFSAKSKNSANLLKDMERKINSLKEELRLVETKIALIDEKL